MYIRAARPNDLEQCCNIDHAYAAEWVWQMDSREDGDSLSVSFRPVRLPREVQVAYPRQGAALVAGWQRCDMFWVAEEGRSLCGYLALEELPAQQAARVVDWVVDRPLRRRGIGAELWRTALDRMAQRGVERMFLEVQMKNHAAISFCRSRRLSFCGYNDRYWPGQEIALFFVYMLR